MTERYRTIVADPPWPIGDMPAWFREDRQSTRERELGHNPRPYGVMTLDEIAALPVAGMAATRAHLYLWTINDHLEQSYGVARAWGFKPSAILTWCKPPRPGGLGGTFPSNTEFVVFCSRDVGADDRAALGAWLREQRLRVGMSAKEVCAAIGAHGAVNHGGAMANWEAGLNAPTLPQWAEVKRVLGFSDERDDEIQRINAEKGELLALDRAPGRWFTWPRGRHSAKPDAFYDLVEQVSPEPRLEMFSRRARLGWDTWGNEALGGDECLACGGLGFQAGAHTERVEPCPVCQGQGA